MLNDFSIAKAVKAHFSTITSAKIYIIGAIPSDQNKAIHIEAVPLAQNSNFEVCEVWIVVTMRDLKENLKTLCAEFLSIEQAIIGNMIDIEDPDGYAYRVIECSPNTPRNTFEGHDGRHIYKNRTFSAKIVQIDGEN